MSFQVCEPLARPRVPAARFNRGPSQNSSWINVHGHLRYPELIGQIYFKTNDVALDDDDLACLEPAAAYLREYAQRYSRYAQKLFRFVGNADHRGSAAYNLTLAKRRAGAVQKFMDRAFFGFPYYFSKADSKGESAANVRDLAGSRRVDIFANRALIVPRDVGIAMDAEVVSGHYSGPRTNRFRFRTLWGAGVGGLLSAGVLSIEIQNARTGRRRMYRYTGAGSGVGFNMSAYSSTWEERTFPYYFDVDDFEGNGSTIGGGVGMAATILIFDGPHDRGFAPHPIEVSFSGFDLALGMSSDAGYWHRVD